jgi:hypothetical protein
MLGHDMAMFINWFSLYREKNIAEFILGSPTTPVSMLFPRFHYINLQGEKHNCKPAERQVK